MMKMMKMKSEIVFKQLAILHIYDEKKGASLRAPQRAFRVQKTAEAVRMSLCDDVFVGDDE